MARGSEAKAARKQARKEARAKEAERILSGEGNATKRQKGIDSGDNDEHYFIELSIKEGQGVEELRQEVMRMLGEVRVVLDAMAKMDERSARLQLISTVVISIAFPVEASVIPERLSFTAVLFSMLAQPVVNYQ